MSRVPELVAARRSIRAFLPDPVPREIVDGLIAAACLAPAPHHSRPWRWAVVDTLDAKHALAEAMGERWQADLTADGMASARIARRVQASYRRLTDAPTLVLGCIVSDGLDQYPDVARQTAEHGMALLSLGAAVQNLFLAATDTGLGSCAIAAPIFCPEVARDALALPSDWSPRALVALGWPDPAHEARPRLPVSLDLVRVRR